MRKTRQNPAARSGRTAKPNQPAGPGLTYEQEAIANGHVRIAGADEAGRGPVAGPIVGAAVILNGEVAGVNDSKLLSAANREALYARLHEEGHCIAVMVISEQEIDRMGLQQANYAVLAGALDRLDPAPGFALVDGFAIPGCTIPHKRLIKGDRLSQSIAAASIIAKVTRDRLMMELDAQYPQYGFARHKGYRTAEHLKAIEEHGPCPVHRTCFAPIARLLQAEFAYDGA
jgi:ribonuclease HII